MKQTTLLFTLLLFLACQSKNETVVETDDNPFSWNFKGKKEIVYSYEQDVDMTNQMMDDEEPTTMKTKGIGQLVIKIKENDDADVVLKDIESEMIFIEEDRDTMQNKLPNTVFQNVFKNGVISDSDESQFISRILANPENQLKKGQKEKREITIAFNANGSKLYPRGTFVLTYLRDENFIDRDCAVFKGEFDISEMDVPEEIQGEFTYSETGHGLYYFDKKEKILVGADVDLDMSMTMKSKQEVNEDVMSFDMESESKNRFKIRLLEIK